MAKFKFYVSTGYVGADKEEIIEIPDEELNGLTEEKRKNIRRVFLGFYE